MQLDEGRGRRPGREYKPRRPNWVAPDLDQEADELERHAKEHGLDPAALRRSADRGRLQPVSKKAMRTLVNTSHTDPWFTQRGGTKKDPYSSEGIAGRRGAWRPSVIGQEYGRDVRSVGRGFKQGDPMPAPIIVHTPGKPPELIAGNTRTFHAMIQAGVRPHAWHVHHDPSAK